MKVRELQAQLSQLNPDIEVLVYSEDTALLGEGQGYRILDIERIDTGMAATERGPLGEPMLLFQKGPEAREIAFLHVVADF